MKGKIKILTQEANKTNPVMATSEFDLMVFNSTDWDNKNDRLNLDITNYCVDGSLQNIQCSLKVEDYKIFETSLRRVWSIAKRKNGDSLREIVIDDDALTLSFEYNQKLDTIVINIFDHVNHGFMESHCEVMNFAYFIMGVLRG